MATYYWRGGSGTWNNSSTTNWSTSPGGPGGSGPPTSADAVFFNSSSSFSGPYTVTVESTAVSLNTSVDSVGSATPTFNLSGNATLCASTGSFTFQAGTLALNSYTLTVGTFISNTTGSRTINFGTGTIALTGNSKTVWQCQLLSALTVSGTPQVSLGFYTGSSGTRTINHGSLSGLGVTTAVSFSVTTGSDTVTLNGGARSLDFTGFTGTYTNTAITLYGSLTTSSGMTLSAGSNSVTFSGSSVTQDITTNGKTLDFPIVISGTNNTVRLLDNTTVGATRQTALSVGTFNANNFNFSTGLFFASGANPRTITMGSGTWTLSGTGTVWDLGTTSNLVFNKDTANIVLSNTSTTARTFAGGSLTYNTLTIGGTTGTSTLTITGNNTFDTLASTKTVAHTIRFSGGSTTTVTNWNINGSSGNLVTLTSSSTTKFTLVKAGGGSVSLSYASVAYSTASPVSTWYAYLWNGNVDGGGGNANWAFTPSFLSLFF